MTKLITAASVLAIGAALALSDAARAEPVYRTPAQAAQSIIGKSPRTGVMMAKITAASCTGIGTSRTPGYATFACQARWASMSGRVWMRVASAGVCVSNRSLGDCPPALPTHPLPGDPRLCSYNDAAHCIHDAVRAAIVQHVGPGSQLCTPTSAFVATCEYSTGAEHQTYTVMFKKGATAWTMTVTP